METQFHKALEHVVGKPGFISGLYMIRPRWAGKRNLVKIGLTKNIHSRLFQGYRHSMPYAAGSFELLAFMRVGERSLFERERQLMANSLNKNGWSKPRRDLEWREHHNPSKFREDIIKLFTMTRRPVGDGQIYVFDPKTGKPVYTGGRPAEIDRADELQNRTNVELRSQAQVGSRIYGFDAKQLAEYNRKHKMALKPNQVSGPPIYQRQLRSIPRVNYARA